MQKYRADASSTQSDGAILWYANWMGGSTLAKINNCRIDGVDYRRTVYITGGPDTWFSIPAATRIRGRYVRGYVTSDDGILVFHAMDSHKHLLA